MAKRGGVGAKAAIRREDRITTSTPRDVASAMKEMGIEPARISSDEVFALCPGHEDTKPNSWSVNRETGFHYCFSCGYNGSFIGLVMDTLRLDPFAASRWIRTHGVELLDPSDIPRYSEVADRRTRRSEKQVSHTVSESSLALFFSPPGAQLEYRQISTEAAVHYDLLWDLENAGWIIPVRLPSGDLLGWQFKSEREFLNYPESMAKSLCLFGLDAARARTAIVVESPLDCARMMAVLNPEEYSVVSSFGAEISDDQMRLLMNRFDHVILAFDNDKAGRKTTARLVAGTVKGYYAREEKFPGWASRMDLWVYNYGESEEKDPGDQSDDEILFGVTKAIPAVAAGLQRVRVGLDDQAEKVSEGEDRTRSRSRVSARARTVLAKDPRRSRA